MLWLALDTSTLVASIAVVKDGVVLAAGDERVTTHSEKLLARIDRTLADAGVKIGDLDAVACGQGPGSFTGLRIGLSTAKGLCFALDRPLVLVSSLAAIAQSARETAREQAPGAPVLALLDARKGEVYAGLYAADPTVLEPLVPEAVLSPDRLLAYLESASLAPGAVPVVVGDGAVAYPEAAARCGTVLPGTQATPPATAVCALASRRGTGALPDMAAAVPTYIRASEAELNLSTGLPGGRPKALGPVK